MTWTSGLHECVLTCTHEIKMEGRREGWMNGRTDVQMDGKRKNRELHAKLEDRDRESEAGGASDFF